MPCQQRVTFGFHPVTEAPFLLWRSGVFQYMSTFAYLKQQAWLGEKVHGEVQEYLA